VPVRLSFLVARFHPVPPGVGGEERGAISCVLLLVEVEEEDCVVSKPSRLGLIPACAELGLLRCGVSVPFADGGVLSVVRRLGLACTGDAGGDTELAGNDGTGGGSVGEVAGDEIRAPAVEGLVPNIDRFLFGVFVNTIGTGTGGSGDGESLTGDADRCDVDADVDDGDGGASESVLWVCFCELGAVSRLEASDVKDEVRRSCSCSLGFSLPLPLSSSLSLSSLELFRLNHLSFSFSFPFPFPFTALLTTGGARTVLRITGTGGTGSEADSDTDVDPGAVPGRPLDGEGVAGELGDAPIPSNVLPFQFADEIIVDRIIADGACLNERINPPPAFCAVGVAGDDIGGGSSVSGMFTFSGTGDPAILGEYAALDPAGVVGPEDSVGSDERSTSLTSPGGRAGIGSSSGVLWDTEPVGGVCWRRPSAWRSMSTAW
jgi:hypothetical protein